MSNDIDKEARKILLDAAFIIQRLYHGDEVTREKAGEWLDQYIPWERRAMKAYTPYFPRNADGTVDLHIECPICGEQHDKKGVNVGSGVTGRPLYFKVHTPCSNRLYATCQTDSVMPE